MSSFERERERERERIRRSRCLAGLSLSPACGLRLISSSSRTAALPASAFRPFPTTAKDVCVRRDAVSVRLDHGTGIVRRVPLAGTPHPLTSGLRVIPDDARRAGSPFPLFFPEILPHEAGRPRTTRDRRQPPSPPGVRDATGMASCRKTTSPYLGTCGKRPAFSRFLSVPPE